MSTIKKKKCPKPNPASTTVNPFRARTPTFNVAEPYGKGDATGAHRRSCIREPAFRQSARLFRAPCSLFYLGHVSLGATSATQTGTRHNPPTAKRTSGVGPATRHHRQREKKEVDERTCAHVNRPSRTPLETQQTRGLFSENQASLFRVSQLLLSASFFFLASSHSFLPSSFLRSRALVLVGLLCSPAKRKSGERRWWPTTLLPAGNRPTVNAGEGVRAATPSATAIQRSQE